MSKEQGSEQVGGEDEEKEGRVSLVSVGILLVLVALAGVAVVKSFGTTVSSKFNTASASVTSEVRFDGGGSEGGSYDYDEASAEPAPQPSSEGHQKARAAPKGSVIIESAGGSGNSPSVAERKRRVAVAQHVQNNTVLGQISDADFASDDQLIDALREEPAAEAPGRRGAEELAGEEFKDYGVNQMTLTSEDRHSTFSVDVDTGSYTLVRSRLNQSVMPVPAAVRVEEFVNYFNYDYPQPDEGVFGVSLEAAPSPFATDGERHLLRVGVQGKRIERERKPAHLVFLVDVSGSMRSPHKLGMAKQALKVLVDNLGAEDSVALVTYAGATRKVLGKTPASQKAKIKAALDDLRPGGGTSMGSGVKMAYEEALKDLNPDHIHRVLVLSDGDANIGAQSHNQILEMIRGYVDDGVTLSTIGFGMGNYNDTMMEQLANKGDGNYYYIDSIQEAEKVFGEQVNGTLEVIAKDVKIQVEFNPEAVQRYRLIGYENRDIADKDFRNDAVDAGEIGAGHTVTAFYEVILNEPRPELLAKVRLRYKKPETLEVTEHNFPMTKQDVRAKLSDTSNSFQFGAAVVAFAEILRESPYAKELTFALVDEIASSAASANQKERQEFLTLVRKADELKDSSGF